MILTTNTRNKTNLVKKLKNNMQRTIVSTMSNFTCGAVHINTSFPSEKKNIIKGNISLCVKLTKCVQHRVSVKKIKLKLKKNAMPYKFSFICLYYKLRFDTIICATYRLVSSFHDPQKLRLHSTLMLTQSTFQRKI